MDTIQKMFEDWAKSVGLDTLALAPSDRLYENRWYYEQTTETAYLGWRACSELQLEYDELEAYMNKLESK